MRTPVEDAHGVVVGLRREGFAGVGLDFGDHRVVGGKGDVGDQDGGRLVQVGLAVEDGVGVEGDRGPTVFGDLVVCGRGGHGGCCC